MARKAKALMSRGNAPDLIEIPVYRRSQGIIARAVVSEEDAARICAHKWYLSSQGYARRVFYAGGKQHSVFMHHEVLQAAPDSVTVVDHFDGNRLNNTRENLRFVDRSLNRLNTSKVRSDSGTGVRGVTFDKRYGKFYAYSKKDGKKVHLGTFDDIKLAADAVKGFRRANFLKIHEKAV